MKFQHRVQNLIRNRTSVRSYQKKMITADDLQKIETVLSRLNEGPLGTRVRFQLIASKLGDAEALKGLGTYGMIRNPAGFVIGAVQPTDSGLVDFGYLMQSIILALMDIGISTCWLGGSFTKSRFSESIEIQNGEQVPAVISIGYPTDQRSLQDRLVRFMAGSKKRKSWDKLFFQSNFKDALSSKDLNSYSQVLEMVRLAPSASNRQPWRIVHDPDKNVYHFYLLRSRAYDPKKVGMADLQMVDMGIGMSHFALTANALNLNGEWVVKDPNIDISISGTEYIVTWKAIQQGVKYEKDFVNHRRAL